MFFPELFDVRLHERLDLGRVDLAGLVVADLRTRRSVSASLHDYRPPARDHGAPPFYLVAKLICQTQNGLSALYTFFKSLFKVLSRQGCIDLKQVDQVFTRINSFEEFFIAYIFASN